MRKKSSGKKMKIKKQQDPKKSLVRELYDWQKKIVEHKGNVTVRGGRQSGKSVSVGERIYKIASEYPGEKTLIIAASERQENYLYDQVRQLIGKGYVGRSTLSCTTLDNGHQIWKFPVGQTGIYLEGLSNVAFLYADEAIHIGQKVWNSILPMLAEPRKRGLGWITLLSTTKGKPKGYFFDSFKDKSFMQIHVKAQDCPHISKEFLEEERKRLGEIMYSVIYDGEFHEEAVNYFPSEMINRAVKIGFFSKKDIKEEDNYYLGIDPARYGKSKAAFVVAKLEKDKVSVVYQENLDKSSLIELGVKTNELNDLFHPKKIFIDDGGFGAGLIDFLELNLKIRRKLRPINNAASGKEGKILKEDLYSNVMHLMQTEKLDLVNDREIIEGLKRVEYDGVEGEEKIIGTDLSEALVRACWAYKEKYKKPIILTF